MNPVSGINFSPAALPQSAKLTPSPGNEQTFKNFLLEGIQNVNTMQQDADKAVETMITGGNVNMAEVLTAVQKADMTFRMMMQVRNKIVQAYQEIKDIRI